MDTYMVICESQSVTFRIFFLYLEDSIHFAEWVDVNGFKSRIEEVMMREHPRTHEEEQLARGMWVAYEQWNKNAREARP